MKWWGRRAGQADLEADLGRRVKVLAEGSGDGVLALGLLDALAVRQESQWTVVEWHLVRHGGWDQGRGVLSWELADGASGSVVLTEPGRLPEMFQERVKATIVVEDRSPAPGGGWVLLVGRRALAATSRADPAIVWQVLAEGPARLSDAAVKEHIVNRVAQLETDYSV